MSVNTRWDFPVIVDGVVFQNLQSMAKEAGINYCCACKRKVRGFSPAEILYGKQKSPARIRRVSENRRDKPIVVANHTYPSLPNAFRTLKPKATFVTVCARIRDGWTHEQALEVEPKVDGRTIPGRLCKTSRQGPSKQGSNNATHDAPLRRLPANEIHAHHARATPSDSLPAVPRRKKRTSCGRKKVELVVAGIRYDTINQLARAYGLDPHLVYNRIRVHDYNPTRAVTESTCDSVEVNGTKYRSAYFAWRKIGRTSMSNFSARFRQRLPLPICLGLEPLPKKITVWFEGRGYTSTKALAAEFGLSASALTTRKSKMPLKEALEFVPPRNGRYSVGYFAKYPRVASRAGRLYFVRLQTTSGIFHKIGITVNEVSVRLGGQFDFIAEARGALKDMYELEQRVLDVFSAYLVRAEESFDGKTETFHLTPEVEAQVVRMMLQ